MISAYTIYQKITFIAQSSDFSIQSEHYALKVIFDKWYYAEHPQNDLIKRKDTSRKRLLKSEPELEEWPIALPLALT